MSYSFPAEYEGRCAICTFKILVGQLIVKYEGEWCHEECAQEVEDDGGD